MAIYCRMPASCGAHQGNSCLARPEALRRMSTSTSLDSTGRIVDKTSSTHHCCDQAASRSDDLLNGLVGAVVGGSSLLAGWCWGGRGRWWKRYWRAGRTAVLKRKKEQPNLNPWG